MIIQPNNTTSNSAVPTPQPVCLNNVLRSGVAYEIKVLPTNLISSARGFMLHVDGTADWVVGDLRTVYWIENSLFFFFLSYMRQEVIQSRLKQEEKET